MGVYVCFDDSVSDPTYSHVDNAFLVIGESEDCNPCAPENVKAIAPMVPNTLEELRSFCRIMGWDMTIDDNGQAVIYTGQY